MTANLNRIVSQKAVSGANSDSRIPEYLKGDIFRIGVDPETLSLEYDRQFIVGAIKVARSKQLERKSIKEICKLLDDIAFDAIYNALASNSAALTSLIVNHFNTKF